jgi:hypothetical protein
VAAPGAQPVAPFDVANDARGCDPAQQGGKVGIGEAIVERHIGNAGDSGAEQRDGSSLAALVEQGHMRATAVGDVHRRALGSAQECAVGPSAPVTYQADALGIGIGRHLQDE